MIGKDGQVTLRRVPNPFSSRDDVLATKVGGKVYYMRFHDPKVGFAVRKIGSPVDLGILTQMVRKVTVLQSIVNTRMNPAFVPVNFLRDVGAGSVHLLDEGFSKRQIAAVLKDIPKAFGALWRHSRGTSTNSAWDRAAKEYMAAGGKIQFSDYKSVEDQLKALEGQVNQAVEGKAAWRKAIDAAMKFLGDINDAVENGIRLADLRPLAPLHGTSDKQAAYIARDLTVDFKKHGEIGPTMNSWFVFFNASIQGNANIVRRTVKSQRGARRRLHHHGRRRPPAPIQHVGRRRR